MLDSVEMFLDFPPFFRFTGKLEIIKPLRSGRSRREDVENTKSLGGAGEMRKKRCSSSRRMRKRWIGEKVENLKEVPPRARGEMVHRERGRS